MIYLLDSVFLVEFLRLFFGAFREGRRPPPLLRPLPFFLLAGGVTAPPEINIFIPSPTDISKGITSSLGTSKRKPLVGFGVVGTKTLVISFLILDSVSLDPSQ